MSAQGYAKSWTGVRVDTREKNTKDAVITIRLPGDLAAALRELAEERGLTMSDLLRAEIQRLTRKPIGWACEHVNMTSLPGVLKQLTGGCGCEMRPVFHARDLPPVREPAA